MQLFFTMKLSAGSLCWSAFLAGTPRPHYTLSRQGEFETRGEEFCGMTPPMASSPGWTGMEPVHDDWITGNNLHAVACGFASHDQSLRILRPSSVKHRAEIEEIIPCRVRLEFSRTGFAAIGRKTIGMAESGPSSPHPTCGQGPALGDVPGALRIAELLATHPKVTDVGFYEAYDGTTESPITAAASS